MAGNIVPRSDGGSNLGTADKEFNVIYAKSFGGTIASQVVTTNSPTFTGTPTAPTAAAGTNTTQLATTAFANAAASAAASSAISTHNLASDAHSATIAAAVNTHNSSTEAHSDIRTAITTAVSTHNTATDAHSTEFAKYLPLSGGALSGASLRRNVDNSSISLFGGSVADAVHGAYFSAFGKDHSNAGSFSITACNGSVASTLMGKHDGTLTWANENLNIVYKNVTIGTITIGTGGYTSISAYQPAVSGYGCFLAGAITNSSQTQTGGFTVTPLHVFGPAGMTITNLQVVFIYK